MTAVEAFAGTVAVVKPQSAFFERHGSRGDRGAREGRRGLPRARRLVLLDVKRGDIGSTAQAYADAYLDPNSPMAVDAITVRPTSASARSTRWSTPRWPTTPGVRARADLQPRGPAGAARGHRRRPHGRRRWCSTRSPPATPASRGSGSIGAVVGATIDLPPTSASSTSTSTARCWCPGIGAQGGTVEDVRRIFGDAARHVLPSELARGARRRPRQGRAARRRPCRGSSTPSPTLARACDSRRLGVGSGCRPRGRAPV